MIIFGLNRATKGCRTRRLRRRRVHRTAADFDHLRWSPNFNTSTITTSPTFFITGTRSKSDRKGSKTTSKPGGDRRKKLLVPPPSGDGFDRERWRWVRLAWGFQIPIGIPANLAGIEKTQINSHPVAVAAYRAGFPEIPAMPCRGTGRNGKRGRRGR